MDQEEAALTARAESLVADHEQLLRALVRFRREHKLTQEAIAVRMGVSQPTVAAFERYDANPTLATIRRYAHAVGVRLHTTVSDDLGTTGAPLDKHTISSLRASEWPILPFQDLGAALSTTCVIKYPSEGLTVSSTPSYGRSPAPTATRA